LVQLVTPSDPPHKALQQVNKYLQIDIN